MANMNFGVNILPKANNTYTLGNSDYKWNIFANSLNGVSLTNIINDIQIDGTSIVSNNIATIPYATTSNAGIVAIASTGYGVGIDNNHTLFVREAASSHIKAGNVSYAPIVPNHQHEAVFYGLAKAAGDSTQSASSNAVGTYTDSAKTAIRNMLEVPKLNDAASLNDFTSTWSAHKLKGLATLSTWVPMNISQSFAMVPIAINSDYKLDTTGELTSDSEYNTYIYEVSVNDMIMIMSQTSSDIPYGFYTSSSISSSTCSGGITITSKSIYDIVPSAVTHMALSCKKIEVDNNQIFIYGMKYDGINSTDYATNTKAGVIKIDGNGLWINSSNGKVSLTKASSANIKAGAVETYPIVPYNQHEAVFYGLAKAAGDSTQASSSNAVGTYTSQAQSAIRNMLAVAPKSSPFFTGAISLGRYHNSADQSDEANTIGYYSIAVGNNIAASGESSQAFGQDTYAVGWASHAEGRATAAYGNISHTEGVYTLTEEGAWASHAEGSDTIANTPCVHVGGQYNDITDLNLAPTWTANTSYAVGDIVKHEETDDEETYTYVYRCITANNDATFDYGKWITWQDVGDFAEIIGNGGYINEDEYTELRSNARALDWQGNEYLNGDLYINCNNDSTGGIAIGEELNKKISITSDTVTGNPCIFNSDVEDIPLKSIKLEYGFSQSGDGDPSPTNIRPITGVNNLFYVHTGKNMAKIRGYSATTATYNDTGSASNTYGTTLSTTGPESSVVITQSQYSSDIKKYHYMNGYFSIRTDNLVDGQKYDISFRVTNITNNPLNASLSDIVVALPTTSTLYGANIDGDTIKFTNFTYRETSPKRTCFFIYNCGMSFTLSEFMITPANTNDGIYEPYNGTEVNVTFPVLGKNLLKITANSKTEAGITYTVNADGTITLSGTATGYSSLIIGTADISSAEKVTISGLSDDTTNITWDSFNLYDADDTLIQNISGGGSASNKTIDLSQYPTAIKMTVAIKRQNNVATSGTAKPMVEIGETASAFEPYTNTVYGGSLDLISGVLTLTHKMATVTSAYVINPGNNAPYRVTIRPFADAKTYSTTAEFANNIVSDKLKPESTGNWHPAIYEGFISNAKNLVFGVPDTISSVELADAWLAEIGGINVVYELETPITVQLTPKQIKTFKGTNTIWTNINSSIEIENYIDLQTIKEYADNAGIQDIQINGTSILNNKIANIPTAANNRLGAVMINGYGLWINSENGLLATSRAVLEHIKAGTQEYRPIVPVNQHEATFYGLAKAASDSTQSASSNAVGNYTDSAKVAIQKMLGIYSAPWELINEETFTNATEADYTITTDSNGNAFELTDIRLLFELPKLSEGDVASSKGNYGQIWFYFGPNDYLVAEPGAFSRNAGDSGKGCWYFIEYKDNMVMTTFSAATTSSNANTIKVRYNSTIGGAAADNNMGIKVISNFKINKIVIKNVTGNGRYKLYGKRKWT